MSKKFLDWNKRFTTFELKLSEEYWLKRFDEIIKTTEVGELPMKRWPLVVEQWSQDEVQRCVYNVADAINWQRFRVSMKRVDTHKKLHMLMAYWVDKCYYALTKDQKLIEKCRVDNYLGALVRGGQLSKDGKYEVLR